MLGKNLRIISLQINYSVNYIHLMCLMFFHITYWILFSCQTLTNEIKMTLATPEVHCTVVQQIISYNLGLQRLLSESRTTLNKCIEKTANASEDQNIQELERVVNHISERSSASIECVFATALCGLNKRFLMMESAAKSKYVLCVLNSLKFYLIW